MRSRITIFVGVLLSVNLFSQPVTNAGELEFAPGRIKTYYSPGHKEKAEYLQILIEDAVCFYEDLLQDTFSFDLYLLDRKTWKQFTTASYPVPHYIKEENKMIMPAKGLFKTNLEPGASLYGKDYYYFSDYLAVHELGHYITNKLEARSYSKWSGEFFADYINVTYMHEKIPGYRFEEYHTCFYTLSPSRNKSLETYGSGGLFELAYHTKFRELANQIYLKHGTSFLYKWIEIWQSINEDVKAGKFENLEITKEMIFQKSIENIQIIEPEIFNEWKKSMRQTYHPWLILFCLVILIGIIRINDTSYTIFSRLDINTRRIHWIIGVPVIRIWYNLRKIEPRRIRYKLIWISILRVLNLILITLLILSLALILF